MAKKGADNDKEPDDKADDKIDKQVKEKVEKVEEKIVTTTGERVNVIGEIKDVKKPDPENPDDVRTYFKKIDEKLSKLLDFHAPKEPEKTPDPEPKSTPEQKSKRRWYDVELI